MQDKSSFELFQIVNKTAAKLWAAENGPEVREALTDVS